MYPTESVPSVYVQWLLNVAVLSIWDQFPCFCLYLILGSAFTPIFFDLIILSLV